jgi:hypothetical protein
MTGTAQLLQQNLQEEQQMLQQVEPIAQQLTQQMAAMGGSMNQGASASSRRQSCATGGSADSRRLLHVLRNHPADIAAGQAKR